MLEKMSQTQDLGNNEAGNTMTILSRSNGWLTVSKEHQSRKNAIDKHIKGNMHKESELSPNWFQQTHKIEAKDSERGAITRFKAMSLNRQHVRGENNRVMMAEPFN